MTDVGVRTHGIVLRKNVMIPMPDGVHLASDVYLPDDGTDGPWPVVFEHIPYRKDEINLTSSGISYYTRLPRNGYAVVRADVRGTGNSEGTVTDEYSEQEQRDGHDAVEWFAEQAWCDGQVNMIGISYGGFTALQVATHRPPHLRTIIPAFFTDDRYTDDCHYRGGLLRLYYDVLYYGNFMTAYNALPPHPDWAGANWAEIWEQHLEHNEPYILEWLAHQVDGPYWRNGSVGEIADRIECPTFMIGGWRDGYPNSPLRLYEKLEVPRKLLIGPWNHALPDYAVPGPRIDYLREVIRWLDHWCKGRDTGIMREPSICYFMQHSEPPVVDRIETAGEWRAEASWPPPGAKAIDFHLGLGGVLEEEPGEAGEDRYDSVATVGVSAGLWSAGVPFGLPGDQRPDEALSLCYTSQPLAEPLAICGRPIAHIHVATSASVLGFAVSLNDVAPDGTSHLVAKGMLNGTRRDSLREPSPLVPGELYELEIPIDTVAWTFAPGHRVRVAIANADWPNVWPTPELATTRVFRGSGSPSRVVLPTVPPVGSAPPPSFAPAETHVERHGDGLDPPRWEVVRDALGGATNVRIDYGRRVRVDPTTIIERQFHMDARCDPARPAGASAHGDHTSRIIRATQVVEARSSMHIQAAEEHLHLTIDLDVSINSVPHFQRSWRRTVRRELL